MKNLLIYLFGIFVLVSLCFYSSCTKGDADPEGGWTEAEKESYNEVLDGQDQVFNDLEDMFLTMDSLEAIDHAYQAFVSSENVSSATINDQGIAVQYSNGMRGGILLNPLDGKDEVGVPLAADPFSKQEKNSFKSLVNQKKMILINPHYWERSYYTDQIRTITNNNLGKVGMEISTFYKNEEATVDRFTELSGYGIIQIYSHGWAYPKKTNITDIYLLTGETANESTSKKYWDELKTGNIPIVKIAGRNNHYLVSPEFITNYNDFSQDTIFFFGGFCYSFLGGWPDIIDHFGDGGYTGYDWSVYTHRNANWSVNSIFHMSDTTLDQPRTLQGWFDHTDEDLSYWNDRDNRTVQILYTGNANLKLWDDIRVSLQALSSDGAPVHIPGEAGTAYPFRCSVVSTLTNLEYRWDIGDGTSPVTTQGNEVNITWANEGEFTLKVEAINKDDGKSIGSATLQVTIGELTTGLVAFMKSCENVNIEFEKGSTLYGFPYGDIIWMFENISWNNFNFSGTQTSYDGKWNSTISGFLSSDGQKISFTVNKEGEDISYERLVKVNMTVENYPLFEYVPSEETVGLGWATYEVNPPGNINYVSHFEAEVTEDGETEYWTFVDFDWSLIDRLRVSWHPSQKTISSVEAIIQKKRN